MHYSGQDMLWLIGSLSNVFRLPFDAHLVRQQFPPPYSYQSALNSGLLTNFMAGGGDDVFGGSGSSRADNLWGGLGKNCDAANDAVFEMSVAG